MNEPALCSDCGGKRVIVTLNITTPLTELGEDQELQLKQRNRGIGLFGLSGKSNTSTMFAVSCIHCGKTTLYATEPNNLVPDKE